MKRIGTLIVTLMAVPIVSSTEIKIVTEYRYPASYRVTPIMGVGSGGVNTIVGGIVEPTDFKTREIGVVMNVEATVADLNKLGNVAMESFQQKKNGNTDLMLAAAAGNLEVVKQALTKGSLVNAKNHFGASALMGAASGGFQEIVNLLIAQKAVVDSKTANGSTALMYAAQNGHVEIVKTLIERGANVNTSDKKGFTAIFYAINGGHAEVVKTLLAHGANIELRDSNGTTPIQLAANKSDKDVIRLLTHSKVQL